MPTDNATAKPNAAVALLTGGVKDLTPVSSWPAMTDEFGRGELVFIEAQSREFAPAPRHSIAKTAFALVWAVLLAGVFTGAGVQLLQSGDSLGYAGIFSALVIAGLIVWMLLKPE